MLRAKKLGEFKFRVAGYAVEEHLDGILSYCDRKVPLGDVESTNQKAKNVIRRAYGYRDEDVKKLKIIQACTPWINEFQPWSRYP